MIPGEANVRKLAVLTHDTSVGLRMRLLGSNDSDRFEKIEDDASAEYASG